MTQQENYEEVKSNFWTPKEEGDEVEGKFINWEATQFGNCAKMQIGDSFILLPNSNMLTSKMDGLQGRDLKVIFNKMVTAKGGLEYRDYSVFVKTATTTVQNPGTAGK